LSVDFIKKRIGSDSLSKARTQQKQLSYFTQSSIQEELSDTYLTQWAERRYATSDYFLNYVKNVLKTPNFLQFYKYLRTPLASSRLVNDRIKPEFERVFHAEDSYFKYTIGSKQVESPEELNPEQFNQMAFNAFLFRFNDVLVSDLNEDGNPITHLVSIDDVVSIDSRHNTIHKVAYSAFIELDEKHIEGYLVVDKYAYTFYDKDLNVTPLSIVEHDLGYCPATWITRESFDGINDPLRKSIFSFVREELEEYDFLKILLKMTEPNGVIPVATILKTSKRDNKTAKVLDSEPMSANRIGGQSPNDQETVHGNTGSGALQAGTIHQVPMRLKEDGSIDMDAVTNFIKFFYLPIEAVEYIVKRIESIEQSILKSTIGIIANQNNSAKNELQIESGYVGAEDRLRSISLSLTHIRKFSDTTGLALKYGVNRVSIDLFYGSKFFMDSIADLYLMLKDSPNSLESRNVLNRISTIRNKFNPDKADREAILYSIMPYMLRTDFEFAVQSQQVKPEIFQLQTRFDYWINKFESSYGDIVDFWDALSEMSNADKTTIINDLILQEVQTAIMPPINNNL